VSHHNHRPGVQPVFSNQRGALCSRNSQLEFNCFLA
jgi:hypothetical protein